MTIGAKRWWEGLAGAVISGGTAAVSASLVVIFRDPKDWETVWNMITLVGVTFSGAAIISLIKYLSQHPVNEIWQDQQDRRGTGVTTPAIPPAGPPPEA